MIYLDNELFKIVPLWPGMDDLKNGHTKGPLMWINWWVSGSLFICKKQQIRPPFQKDSWCCMTAAPSNLPPSNLPISQVIFHDDVQPIGPWVIPATTTAIWVTRCRCWCDWKFLPNRSSVFPVKKMQSPRLLSFFCTRCFFFSNTTCLIQHCEEGSACLCLQNFLCCGFERKEFLQSTHPRSAQSFYSVGDYSCTVIAHLQEWTSDNSRRFSSTGQRWCNKSNRRAESRTIKWAVNNQCVQWRIVNIFMQTAESSRFCGSAFTSL